MFVDRVKINIKGGNGGNGCVSFYRAKYITNGGPDGGEGGRGGDIIFEADAGMNTLVDFRYKRKFAAPPGEDGKKLNCTGKDGTDIVIKVPPGTIVREDNSGKVMADLHTPGERRVLIRGGKGGRGNKHYATPVRQAPKYAERGKLSRAYDVILELKLIADAGIIGFPNAGKSSLLAAVTNANPKIANYQFTTLSPNLGVVRGKWERDFVLADIPGLIEGASEGVGLGFEFLRHIERTKVLIHVVDMTAESPVGDIEKINAELNAYNENLMLRPRVIAANKMDIYENDSRLGELEAYCAEKGWPLFMISAAAHTGLDKLLEHTARILEDYPEDIVFTEDYEEYAEVKIDEEPFTVTRESDGYTVAGNGIERMIGYTNLDTEKGLAFFQKYMREKGVFARLEEMDVQEGETIRIYGLEFDYYK